MHFSPHISFYTKSQSFKDRLHFSQKISIFHTFCGSPTCFAIQLASKMASIFQQQTLSTSPTSQLCSNMKIQHKNHSSKISILKFQCFICVSFEVNCGKPLICALKSCCFFFFKQRTATLFVGSFCIFLTHLLNFIL
jgi:hypothetical protein